MTKRHVISIILISSVLTAVASLTLSTFFKSSEAQAQSCLAVQTPIVRTLNSSTVTSNNNGTWATLDLGTHTFCILSYVAFNHTDDDEAACQIVYTGGSWTLQARESNDDDTRAQCQAMCFN